MPQAEGHSLSLSLPRRLMGDYLHCARQVPTVPVERCMCIAEVAAARAAAQPRPSWGAVFLKAYALVARLRPQLRRTYLSFPWPRLYEHPFNVASIAIERQYEGEEAVLFAHIRMPESHRLRDIDRQLRAFKEQPLDQIDAFRRALTITRLPWPVRRLAWWAGLNIWGHKKARRLGTFGMSIYGSLGAASLHPLSPLTTVLNFGPISAAGHVTVRLIYDHRVLDGATVARALADLERTLHGDILYELRDLRGVDAA
ncbi:MAG: hypothetical protein ACK4RK_19675 [Gemmataceae bacterium]